MFHLAIYVITSRETRSENNTRNLLILLNINVSLEWSTEVNHATLS